MKKIVSAKETEKQETKRQRRSRETICLSLLLASCFFASLSALTITREARSDTLSLNSYYPSPFGIYDRLRLVPRAADPVCVPGTLFVKEPAVLRYCSDAGWIDFPLSPGGGVWTKTVANVYLTDTDPAVFVGIGTTTPEFKLTLDQDGGILAKGTYGSGAVLSTAGDGARLIWYPRKAAFRAGAVSALDPPADEWNDVNIGNYSTVAGGLDNMAKGDSSVVGGGRKNIAYTQMTTIGGGENNLANMSTHGVVAGGRSNGARNIQATIGGGTTNLVESNMSVVAGGTFNQAGVPVGVAETVAGGDNNIAGGALSTITGGQRNRAEGAYSTVAGGGLIAGPNRASGDYSTVAGGSQNATSGGYSVISGGNQNTTSGGYSTVAAGILNHALTTGAAVSGGYQNSAAGVNSTVGGGGLNRAEGNLSIVPGGNQNMTYGDYSWAGGSNMQLDATADRTFIWGHSNAPITPVTTPDAFIIYSGNVGIGQNAINPQAKLHVDGNIKIGLPAPVGGSPLYYDRAVSREIGYDVAELFETIEPVQPGDILVMDESTDKKYTLSRSSYNTKVVGVVSGAAAIVFEGSELKIAPAPGEFTAGVKPPVALAGRVLCNVTTQNGPIKPGDLLTTSSVPGHAMKATDRAKSFGAIIGKAIEPFSGPPEGETTGKILIFL